MLEELIKLFGENGSVTTAINIIHFCRTQKLYNIGFILAKEYAELFPSSVNMLLESAMCAKEAQDTETSYDLFQKILAFDLKLDIVNAIFTEKTKLVDSIQNRYTSYNSRLVSKISRRKYIPFPFITFTITTCKRFDLLEKTMNSFLQCCTDVHRIDKWLCVDDNSSEEDREKMQKQYPFFEFVFKNADEKGHAKSMNIIRNKVTTPYIFHTEDDWKFFEKRPYITECLDVLSQSETISQCLINKNYGELACDIDIVGGFPAKTSVGTRYFLHEYAEDMNAFALKHPNRKTCAYWTGFSFRPSLLKREVLTKVGDYNENTAHFEMEYSKRCKTHGYNSAFLEGIYSIHIGRLTTEIGDSTKKNAYALNETRQFQEVPQVPQPVPQPVPQVPQPEPQPVPQVPQPVPQVPQPDPQPDPQPVPQVTKSSILKTFIVNLETRTDRWNNTVNNMPSFLKYQKFMAINGKELQPTENLQRIFEGNDYDMRSGMVGCALSHIKLWIELLESKCDIFLILEDDITFVPDFEKKFKHMYSNLPENWDICFLGHHVWPHLKKDEYTDKEKLPTLEKYDASQSLKHSMGGTFGYIISKKGAMGMLDFIDTHGMTNCIDTMQQKAGNTLNLYYNSPHLIYSECNNTDSDIQKEHKSLTTSVEERFKTIYQKCKDPKLFASFDEIEKYVRNPSSNVVGFYSGSHIRELVKMSVHPCYVLGGNKILIVTPECVEKNKNTRLKRDGKYSIEDVIVTKLDILFIPMRTTNATLKGLDANELPYDKDIPYLLMEGNFESFSLLTEITCKLSESELDSFLTDFFTIKPNKYNITFPHENVENLKSIYSHKLRTIKNMILNPAPLVFVHEMPNERTSIDVFTHFIDFVTSMRSHLRYRHFVKLFIVNAIHDSVPESHKKYIQSVTVPIDRTYDSCVEKEIEKFATTIRF